MHASLNFSDSFLERRENHSPTPLYYPLYKKSHNAFRPHSLRPTQSPTATPRPRAVFVFGPCRCVFNKPLTSGKNANVFNSQSTSFSKTKVGTKIVTMTLITVRRELALSLSRAAVSMAVDLV